MSFLMSDVRGLTHRRKKLRPLQKYDRGVTELSAEGLLQLAQYQPYRDGGASREETFRQMVCPVLMEAGGQVACASDLQDAFKTLYGVEVDPDELKEWLEHLESKGAIERTGAAIVVSQRAHKLLEEARVTEEALAQAARSEWRASLVTIEPALIDEELDDLEGDLDQLIAWVVAYHGAEAAVVLFPEQERSLALRQTLRSKTDALPRRSKELDEVRRRGLEQFFQAPTENQRRYLAGRLDFGFFATVGTLRPEGAAAVREELVGQRLYLDTNVMIGAFGLAGRDTNQSVKRLLDLTKGLGVELAVTSRTLEEFRHSLERAKDQIVSRGLPSRRYAGVLQHAAREFGGVSLLEGYYESYGEFGSAPDDWFRRASQFEPALDELGIAIEDEGLDAVLKTEGPRINDYVVLINREAAFRSRRARDDLPMQHDAIHRALIERLRGEGQRRFGTAQYWFLTEDKVLPRFGQLALEGEAPPNVPFCISGAAWRQIARCFTPRTEDYDQTITDLLASPYLRFGKARDLAEVQQAVSRISTLLGENASPTVVAAAVNDETLEAAAGADTPDAQDKILVEAYQRSEDELAERLKLLNERVQMTEGELDEEREKHQMSAQEISAAEADNEALQRQLNAQQQELAASQEALERERSSSAEEIEKLKRERREDEERDGERRETRKKAAILVAAIALFVIALGLFLLGVISAAAALLGGAAAISLLVAPFIEHSVWAWRVGFVLAVVGVALGVVSMLD